MEKDYSKIKNLIFDLDNTIILDEDDDVLSYKKVLEDLGYNPEDYYKIFVAVDEYEASVSEEELYFTKQGLLEFLNKRLNRNYKLELIDGLCDAVGKYWIRKILLDEKIVNYLSQKYKLYVYTNFFGEAQYQRLKNIGYDKYFEKVFGPDVYGLKPYKKSIELVLNEIGGLPEECLMIGDSKDKEILSADIVGMQAILFDYNGMRDKKDIKLNNYIVIKKFDELLNIL